MDIEVAFSFWLLQINILWILVYENMLSFLLVKCLRVEWLWKQYGRCMLLIGAVTLSCSLLYNREVRSPIYHSPINSSYEMWFISPLEFSSMFWMTIYRCVFECLREINLNFQVLKPKFILVKNKIAIEYSQWRL